MVISPKNVDDFFHRGTTQTAVGCRLAKTLCQYNLKWLSFSFSSSPKSFMSAVRKKLSSSAKAEVMKKMMMKKKNWALGLEKF
ncbi:hypothetical protein F3Y22_tig00111402pilonHSYRG00338 [Hibiscus syriacus]|uniref:Uncharacterized protein n=1 Tax=Hibiscus syriacus TaxID=106335 RepID=A0A6A2YL54_HIBSY|nr:hypothetical protein F3Y22_tig00111402pilonHSYRG00338 [Hibiscus syriacus]